MGSFISESAFSKKGEICTSVQLWQEGVLKHLICSKFSFLLTDLEMEQYGRSRLEGVKELFESILIVESYRIKSCGNSGLQLSDRVILKVDLVFSDVLRQRLEYPSLESRFQSGKARDQVSRLDVQIHFFTPDFGTGGYRALWLGSSLRLDFRFCTMLGVGPFGKNFGSLSCPICRVELSRVREGPIATTPA